jgi:hypothetical protein
VIDVESKPAGRTSGDDATACATAEARRATTSPGRTIFGVPEWPSDAAPRQAEFEVAKISVTVLARTKNRAFALVLKLQIIS